VFSSTQNVLLTVAAEGVTSSGTDCEKPAVVIRREAATKMFFIR